MSLNRKQKKQLEAARNRQRKLQQMLTAARQQPDEPDEISRLEQQMATLQAEIDRIKVGS